MRIGCGLPQAGTLAGPAALVEVARHAEELGYDDVWVFDRLLWPLEPRAPYPASSDGKLPDAAKAVLDPVVVLAFVAAHTRRIGLGTSVLNLPFYNPVLLARQLSAVDVLSGGRLRLGFGTGWSPDEFEAVGAPTRVQRQRTDEALQVLKAIWANDPVAFSGEHYHVPLSYIGPKPVQRPHPPLYFAAYTPAALERVAREADGWLPAGLPIATMQQMFSGLQEGARRAGRDPNCLELIVRANLWLSDAPLGPRRAVFTGSRDEIAADIEATRSIGAHGIILDAQGVPQARTIDGLLRVVESLRALC
jgi:probable F420-dependent oxidoreductase